MTFKGEKKIEYYTYLLVETITIIPFLLVRVILGISEDFINLAYVFTNALVCIRVVRIQYLSKYIVKIILI